MRCSAARLLASLAAIPWIGAPRVALAADPACSTVEVQEDPRVRSRWPRLSELIHEAFEGRDDIDACARIELKTSAASTVDVTVVLPDGRSASRSARGDDVLPTLEALLLVPQIDAMATPAPAATPQAIPSTGASPPADGELPIPLGSKVASHDVALSPPRLASPPSSPVRIELSVFADARTGNGQTGLGLGAVSLLEIRQWLVGFEGQVERYRQLAVGPAGGALEFGALGGRRFRFEDMAVDLLAGPALALRGRMETTTVSPGEKPISQSNEELVPRARFGARIDYSARSMLRGFVGLEAELGPAGTPSDPHLSEATGLPLWTVGLALGATVGTP